MYLKEIVTTFSGLLTPFIAIITLYIAYQQWQTNRRKLILDLYDRRIRIYKEVHKIILIISKDWNPSIQDLQEFKGAVSDANFLFGVEIIDYIDEIFERGLNLSKLSMQYRDYSQTRLEGYNNDNLAQEMYTEEAWFYSQFRLMKQVFKKYLDCSIAVPARMK
jgi:hypothetical protein